MSKPNIWIRHVMDKETRKLVAGINPSLRDVFEISGNSWSDMFPWKTYTSSTYPEFDVCRMQFPAEYDLIICEQVFEHIRYPWKAIRNIYSALRSGGYVLITTPFMFHIHPTPLDCWRWTPQGMRFLLEDGGFELEDTVAAGWGNLECFLQHTIDRSRAPTYDNSMTIHNLPYMPQVVWGLGRKR